MPNEIEYLEARVLEVIACYLQHHLTSIEERLKQIMTSITDLQTQTAGLVSDQVAFNAKVDTDLTAIQTALSALSTTPAQSDIDAITAQVVAVRAGLASEQSKIDAVVPAASVAPAA